MLANGRWDLTRRLKGYEIKRRAETCMHCIGEYNHVEKVPHCTSSVDTKGGCKLAQHSAVSPLHYCQAGSV